MTATEKKQNRHQKIILIFDIALYFFFLFLTSKVSSERIQLDIFGIIFESTSICGVMTAVNCVQLLWIVIKYKKKGFLISLILYLIHIFLMLIPLFVGNGTRTVPGIAVVIVNMITLTAVYIYISETEKGKQMLFNQANTDSITDLPNMRALHQYISELIESKREFALVFIDIDNFKAVNDIAGHATGDRVLNYVAHEWIKCMNNDDYLVRIGGDEFALIVPLNTIKERAIDHVNVFSDSINSDLGLSYEMFRITASFGVAFFPDDGNDCTSLLSCADTAMYYSKRDGKAKITLYNSNMINNIKRSVETERLIKESLENNSLFVMFQPQYSAKDKKLRGFEALVRIDSNGTTVYPGKFISDAESSRMIYQIDFWVMKNVMNRFSELLKAHGCKTTISVNVSAIYLLDDKFLREFKQMMDETGFPPECLEIEVTESICISSINHAVKVLNELRSMGVSVAIDDFGTGYASLKYLSCLPVQILKIDKTFIDNIATSQGADDFAAAIVTMGHVLKMDIVAEGVENEEQLNILRDIDCDFIQGYLWSKPISEEEAVKLIESI